MKRLALPLQLPAARPKRLRFVVFKLPGRLIRHARRLVLRMVRGCHRFCNWRHAGGATAVALAHVRGEQAGLRTGYGRLTPLPTSAKLSFEWPHTPLTLHHPAVSTGGTPQA